jgi:tryptophanyl-tRNA synthetase
VEEAKNPDESQIFLLYKLFASKDEQDALAARYRAGGMGWGEAKEELFRVVNRELTPLRERFQSLVANPKQIDETLALGAEKARAIAGETIRRLRGAVGIDR